MLYTRKDLSDKNFIDSHAIVQRYINKVFPRRKEFKVLKWHELDFLFQHMKILKNGKGKNGFDLLRFPEAKYYVLYSIILMYGTSTCRIDFNQKAYDYYGLISHDRKEEHRSFFYKYMNEWFDEFIQGSGPYYSIMKPMYTRKEKELLCLKAQKVINQQSYVQRLMYMKACFFNIYYSVRLYFDEYKNDEKCDTMKIDGFDVYADIYTYSHVLNRHYFPYMNKGIISTMNADIPGVDIRNLPKSLLQLVNIYSHHKHLETTTEYLLFKIQGEPYILWIKYGKIGILSGRVGFEIRSFYKCGLQNDLGKFDGKADIQISNDIVISI